LSVAIGSARFAEFMDGLSVYTKVPEVRDLTEEVRASSY
jgi:hypothetical protein